MFAAVLILAAVAGASAGSFGAVVAQRGWHGSLRGRSRCDACQRRLRWFELVPLLSYPALRGRCRRCHARIGPGLYALEWGGAAVGVAAAAAALMLSGR